MFVLAALFVGALPPGVGDPAFSEEALRPRDLGANTALSDTDVDGCELRSSGFQGIDRHRVCGTH